MQWKRPSWSKKEANGRSLAAVGKSKNSDLEFGDSRLTRVRGKLELTQVGLDHGAESPLTQRNDEEEMEAMPHRVQSLSFGDASTLCQEHFRRTRRRSRSKDPRIKPSGRLLQPPSKRIHEILIPSTSQSFRRIASVSCFRRRSVASRRRRRRLLSRSITLRRRRW